MGNNNLTQFEKGVFTISLDFELIWGTLDHNGLERFGETCLFERQQVIDRLLALFVEFDISATWCIVGHLFLDKCESHNGIKHPEITRPTHDWVTHDWFEFDPHETENEKSVFVGRSLVEKIRDCAVRQEIGSHSFSHVIFSDSGCSRETAASEIRACKRIADEMGISLRSFAFPRNEVGHLDVLKEYGIDCYRGVEPHWYEMGNYPKKVRRLAHLFDVLTAKTPPVVMPEKDATGLWNIPGSAIYFPMHGKRRYLPMPVRTRRAVKGLNRAAREKRIFHFWFHPTNMADRADKMFAGLRQVLEYAAGLREKNQLEILTMEGILDRVI
jgi:peptidoglycan/xylan/chitin deacetylase (PgdA/CDA1 family)